MKKIFKNPLKVKQTDSLGVAALKVTTDGYIKGVLTAGAGLGVLALIGMAFSKKVKSEKKEEEVEKDDQSDLDIFHDVMMKHDYVEVDENGNDIIQGT